MIPSTQTQMSPTEYRMVARRVCNDRRACVDLKNDACTERSTTLHQSTTSGCGIGTWLSTGPSHAIKQAKYKVRSQDSFLPTRHVLGALLGISCPLGSLGPAPPRFSVSCPHSIQTRTHRDTKAETMEKLLTLFVSETACCQPRSITCL